MINTIKLMKINIRNSEFIGNGKSGIHIPETAKDVSLDNVKTNNNKEGGITFSKDNKSTWKEWLVNNLTNLIIGIIAGLIVAFLLS